MKKLFFILLLLFSEIILAQTFSLKGKVTDSKSGEPLIGANVKVRYTTYGAATDLKGNYEINNLKNGIYNLQISFIGYQTKNVDSIKIDNQSITYKY